jgi:hypothetical protein
MSGALDAATTAASSKEDNEYYDHDYEHDLCVLGRCIRGGGGGFSGVSSERLTNM